MTATSAYARAARYFRPDLGKIVFSTLLIGLTTLSSLAQPFPLAILIDVVFMNKSSVPWPHRLFRRFAPHNVVSQIIILAVITIVLRLLQELIGIWQGYYKVTIGYNGLLRVRCDLYRKLQALSLAYHRARPQGDAIYRVSYDTIGVLNAFNVMQTTFVNAIILVCMSAIMLSMNWKLGLIAMAIMPVLFGTIKYYGRILTTSARRAAEVDSELTSIVQRSVTAISLVQSFGREEHEYGRFHTSVKSFTRASIRMHMHSMVYWLAIGTAFGIGLGLIFGVGGYMVYAHPQQFTVGEFWIFLQYTLVNLYDPLFKLSGSGADLSKNLAGMQRVYEVLDTPTDIKDAPDAISLEVEPRTLAFDHVSFAYGDGPPVLNDLNVTIRPGEMVAFVGPSGVGKSSLLSLLPRFYDPHSGKILLGDHDIRQIKLRDLRRHIALVLQDALILPTSVAENIAYGKPSATPQQIQKAAELAGADEFINSLPQKYDTVLNEGGNNLSGGQRQRLSIARALATEAPILVLDEPTSALDPLNEQMITETLSALKRHRTMIVVSHRLSTVADCDRIYVMDAGRIIEQGTHEELIARGGAYYRMARHQMKLGEAVAT
ncbi:MAG TPA: ABC transporter ATP-binding protein [Tepidisphaeraceae bacterium]|jgi:subfamily B ATP-binding cassette protein MsbA|nr:ABC transporter ATP-binding protein [Tepidisphaeraceae bacterium]